jgi:arsenate reductase (glutaredoxin)
MAPFASPTLLHNPRCSKSRAAKALLDERKVAYEERRYLEQPLSGAELAVLRERLGLPAREWVRAGEPEYAQAGLTPEAGDEAILAAMARFPVLIERPILILPDSAVVGRPPDRILELLDGDL